MLGGGRDDDERTGGREHAMELGAVPRREDVQDELRRAVGERQPAPRVAERGRGARVCACGAAERWLRDIEGEPSGVGQRVEHYRELVPRAGARVHDQARPSTHHVSRAATTIASVTNA